MPEIDSYRAIPSYRPYRRIFAPYFDLKKTRLMCPNCGWQGTGADLALVEVFAMSAIIKYACPKCSRDIAFTAGPTIAESRANWDQVSKSDRLFVGLVESQRRNTRSEKALRYIGKLKAHRRKVTSSRWLRRVFIGMNVAIAIAYLAVMLR
jgi:hypothetical protein